MTSTCDICGSTVRSETPADWHPGKRARRAERDLQAHIETHSFAEVLRYEIRKDIDLVPDEQRPGIIRDIYRSLLGSTSGGSYRLADADSQAAYSIDEALGDMAVYKLWRSANACGRIGCQGHG
jgi:hypothetical protein